MTPSSNRPEQTAGPFLLDALGVTSTTARQVDRSTRSGSVTRGAASVAAAALVIGLLLAHYAGNRQETKFGADPIGPADIAIVDLGDVAITVQVTNHGTVGVTPSCQVQAGDANGSHHGTGTFTLRAPLEPGQTTTFVAKVRISGQGAASVTQATSTCR